MARQKFIVGWIQNTPTTRTVEIKHHLSVERAYVHLGEIKAGWQCHEMHVSCIPEIWTEATVVTLYEVGSDPLANAVAWIRLA